MFITFEGGEGSGKTTLIKYIANFLAKEHNVITTREPGGSMVAEAIRDIILDPRYKEITAQTEALLFAASRAQHLDEVVLQALSEKKIVLCDRYLDSSLAYQAYARGLGVDFILQINQYAAKHMPTLTFYIDLSPKVGIARISNRKKYDRLDQETVDFHNKVRQGYLKVAQMYPRRIVVIDGNKSLSDIKEQIILRIREAL